MSNHNQRGVGVRNITEDDFVQINVSSTEFKNADQGGVIQDVNPEAKLYLSQDGNVRLVQGTVFPPLGQAGLQLYDFDKGDWTSVGLNLVKSENDRTNLLNATKIELQKEIARRKKSGVEQTDVTIGADSIIDASGEQTKEDKIEKDDPPPTPKQEASFEFPEFGEVDKILQQLSLRNLKYPIDADYGNTQDYIQINQFSYKSPTEGYFFPKASGKIGTDDYKSSRRVGFDNALETAALGVRTGTPKEKAIGLVKLPMPNSLADSNNVSWGPDQLNAITAAATSAMMGTSNLALDGLMQFLSNPENFKDGIGGILSKGLSGTGNFIKATGKDIEGAFSDIPGGGLNAAMNNSNINLLGKTVLGSTLLNFIGFQVSPESILARGAGVIPNNNLALLFNSPTLREFSFSWKMSPRSREEATRVNNILRFFKQGMAAKKSNNSRGSGGSSYFLGTPNVFDIHFKTAKTKDYQILDRNDSVLRIKTCACTGAAVNYTPEGMWNAYEKGQPVAITLTLRFNELEPIFDTDYDNNYFNFDPQRTDLLPVPTDAVGY